MTTLARLRVDLTGWVGGPGVNTWYFSPGVPPGNDDPDVMTQIAWDVRNAMSDIAGLFPSAVSWTPNGSVDLLDSETGQNTGVLALTEPITPGSGSAGTSATSRATMICVNLLTGHWLNGRQLRGRHFLGPIDAAAIVDDGSISSATAASVAAIYSGFLSGLSPRLCVLHRPKVGFPGTGEYADVTSVSVMRRPAVLRSRRD